MPKALLSILKKMAGVGRRGGCKAMTVALDHRLPISGLVSDLGLQVACLTAGTAIINAVFAQAGVKQALAQSAVFVAGATSFRLVADHALEILGHRRRLA
jgi:hypothetical protein